jgi:hypothetical protein
MEHEDAIRTSAVERYLLDQMVEDEQAIFEEHYFDCRVCAADITDGARLLAVGRVVVEQDAHATNVIPIRHNWFEWMPTAAAASLVFGLLGTGIGYQTARMQHQRPSETELVRPVLIDTSVLRAGSSPEVPTVRAGDELKFDVRPHEDAVSYAAVITCGGKIQSRLGISREMAADAIPLRLGELPADRCELVIEGVRKDGKRFEITRNPLQVVER